MLCPKCGQEYTGDSCPRCEGPKIIVNNKEYLARKMEYEKKQAGIKSASSSDADKYSDTLDESADGDVRPDEVLKRIVEKVGKNTVKNDADGKNDDAAKADRLKRRRKIRRIRAAVFVCILAAVVIFAAVFAVRIIKRNNQTLYTIYNGKIYNVSGIDSKYVCDIEKAYFTADVDEFYVPDEPSGVSGKSVTDKMASSDGKYFTSVVYDDSSKIYSLYLWNDEENYILSQSGERKTVVYVSDDGIVLYTETQMINDVGGIGSTGLYLSQIVKSDSSLVPTTTQLSDSVRQSVVYPEEQLVIYNTSDDVLYSFFYGKNKVESVIDYEVSAIYTLVQGKTGCYSYTTASLNTAKNVSSVVYVSDGKAYLYDCASNSDAQLIDSTAAGVSSYIIGNYGIYAIGTSALRYASYSNKQLTAYNTLVTLGATSNYVYFPDRETIVAVTSDGALKTLNRGNVRDITDNVSEGSLSAVNNTDTGIVYVRGKILYYMSISSFNELIVSESTGNAATSDTLIYRNRLYYYNSAGMLCSCTVKGNDNRIIGDVDRFWLGR